jgi:hypothetical protein
LILPLEPLAVIDSKLGLSRMFTPGGAGVKVGATEDATAEDETISDTAELLITWEDENIVELLTTSEEEEDIVELLTNSEDGSAAELLTSSTENNGVGGGINDGAAELLDDVPAEDEGVGEEELLDKTALLTTKDEVAELLAARQLLAARLLLALDEFMEDVCIDEAELVLLEDETVSHLP